jgi:hypothetical protein
MYKQSLSPRGGCSTAMSMSADLSYTSWDRYKATGGRMRTLAIIEECHFVHVAARQAPAAVSHHVGLSALLRVHPSNSIRGKTRSDDRFPCTNGIHVQHVYTQPIRMAHLNTSSGHKVIDFAKCMPMCAKMWKSFGDVDHCRSMVLTVLLANSLRSAA